jgi:COP9 signalosome complex subunit 4
MEHNLLSISNLFVNISFQQLASLLSISASQAESVAANMMGEGRLKGKIDQVDRIIHFDQPSPIEAWNKSFATLCEDMDTVIQRIETKYPDWYAKQKGVQ